MIISEIKRPHYGVCPVDKITPALTGPGMIWQEKMDGCWEVLNILFPAGSRELAGTFVGERMDDKSFWAFDLIEFAGDDIRDRPLIERLTLLRSFAEWVNIVPSGKGMDFLNGIWQRGGEGVVIKDGESPFGSPWLKVKRQENFHCVVTEKHTGGRASIRVFCEGRDGGWVPCRAAFERIAVGQKIEILAFGRHKSGLFREAKLNPHPN